MSEGGNIPRRPPNYSGDTRGFYFIPETVTGDGRANTTLGPGLALLLLSSYRWMRWNIIIFTVT